MNLEELRSTAAETRDNEQRHHHRICVCTAAGCLSSGSDQVLAAIRTEARHRADDGLDVKSVGCLGLCSRGPLVEVSGQDQPSVMYGEVKKEDGAAIVASITEGPVTRLQVPLDAPFFTRQHKIVLENSGHIDPSRLEDYVARDGYVALTTVLSDMTPGEVVEEVTRSGLRGRGGGGFPVGLKWGPVAKAVGATKYVVCNADEGDPGAFMDRSVLESDPHRVLEGMAIAAYAVGASHGYVYVRAEYPLAIQRLREAIRLASRNHLLGNSIGGTPFNFQIDIRLGAGAFVCGEETALLASIEGRRGQPRPRPPYPAERGLFGCPTLINNVESLANIPPILRRGGRWYAGIGTEKSKGTKVFALAGRVVNTGLIEVPMGITLREIVYEIGGGIPNGRAFKAVQTGGPSGGCIPEGQLDMPVDYDSLQAVGSIMGSGGMIVMDETSSMVDVARYFMEFCTSESCGKCVPCRVGTYQMHELLKRIADGEGTAQDLALLEELGEVVRATSLCGLGQSAPNPVRSTLRYFRHEYMDKLVTRRTHAVHVPGPGPGRDADGEVSR